MAEEPTDYVIVTNWEVVPKDDFYLSDKWIDAGGQEAICAARKLAVLEKLFKAYIVPATWMCVYSQMDSSQVYVDRDCCVVLHCESAVIDNKFQHCEKYDN